jgi:hypothetical protein
MPARLFLSVLVSYIIALAEDSNGLNSIWVPGAITNNAIEGFINSTLIRIITVLMAINTGSTGNTLVTLVHATLVTLW